MASVVSTLFLSLDGVAEVDPAWHFPYFDDAMGAAVAADYAGADVLVLGRVTFEVYPMRLLRSEVYPTGVIRLVYAPGDLPGGGWQPAEGTLAAP